MAENKNWEPLPIDNSEEVSFNNDPVADGDYELQLEKAWGRKSGAGNPLVEWEFKIAEGEAAGRRIWHSTPTTGRGAGMLRAVVEAFGYDYDEWVVAIGGQITPEALVGLYGERAKARIKTDTPDDETLAKYPNAKPRNKVSRFVS